MIYRIVVFQGSRKDYESILKDRIDENDNTIPFMEMIQQYNARLRPNESAVSEDEKSDIKVDNCIVRSDDYGSVLEHVLSNFVNIVTLNHDVGILYVQNPPKRVLRSLESSYPSSIEYLYSTYPEINRETLQRVYHDLDEKVLGQEICKKNIISGIYRLTTNSSNRPVVLMLYGPAGVGKTETAKCISKTLGGSLLRIQFSMMQTAEAYNYVFGAEHSKSSFARDMVARESDVILIDEFDKVSTHFYNAFYELFDEGRYVDTNYEVDLKRTIFLLTCNFKNEEEIKRTLGPAMFSRIGCCIEYTELSTRQKLSIIDSWYKEILEKLKAEEKDVIKKADIISWFNDNASKYNDIRILKTKMENAIFNDLTEEFIIQKPRSIPIPEPDEADVT